VSFVRALLLLFGRPVFVLITALVVSIFLAFKFIISLLFYRLSFLKQISLRLHRKPRVVSVQKHETRKGSLIKQIAIAAVFSWSVTTIGVFGFWMFIVRDLPSPDQLSNRIIPTSTKIYDRNGVPLYTIYKDENRTPISLSEVPLHVRLATLAAEDAEFYDHPGFSARGVARALYKYIHEGKITGGSTITQQLVKNALLSPERTLIRKVREMLIAVEVERIYTKDQILEMYLNEVPYGGTAYGIQEASLQYFNKHVDKLTLAEAALLAGLPKSPTHYSPFSGSQPIAKMRQEETIQLMADNGFITQGQADHAKAEPLDYASNNIDIISPHFVMYVRGQLVDTYGEEFVAHGGLRVTTTLDSNLQTKITEIIQSELKQLTSLHVTNAAVVVLKPTTGEILAMVGSKDYFDEGQDGNVNVAIRERQPGSTIKVVNYAYALSHGYTPATIIDDSPITYKIEGQPPYIPKNYDGAFKGPLTLRSAFAQSRNVPAVKVLESYGVKNMYEMGRKMGIYTWENLNNYGLSLTLGGGGVTLLELAEVYATVANEGRHTKSISVKQITNDAKKAIYRAPCENTPCGDIILDPRVAFQIIDILRDNEARAPAFGSRSALFIPDHDEVAVKTGTSNDLRDNFTVGFNQDYLVAVWVGNNDNSPMSRIASGVTGASPIWNKIMTMLIGNTPGNPWKVPSGMVSVDICPQTGTLPCDGCGGKKEWFLEENTPKAHCTPINIAKSREGDELN